MRYTRATNFLVLLYKEIKLKLSANINNTHAQLESTIPNENGMHIWLPLSNGFLIINLPSMSIHSYQLFKNEAILTLSYEMSH